MDVFRLLVFASMFIDCSARIARNPPSLHGGVAVLDIDRDGFDEFIIANVDGPNRVLKWDGSRLLDIAPRTLADPNRHTLGFAAADFNGDGDEELYMLNASTTEAFKPIADRLFALQPNGHWEDLFTFTHNRVMRNFAQARTVGVVDRRGSGRYSFLVANAEHPARCFEQSSVHRIVDLAEPLGLSNLTALHALRIGPLFSDGCDIFGVTDVGSHHVYVRNGEGPFRNVQNECGVADLPNRGRVVVLFDANGDGRLDLCLGHADSPHRLWVRDITGRFHDHATPAMALPSSIRSILAADFDNDGFEELFFHNHHEPNRLFACRDGSWRLLDAGEAVDPDGLATGATIADIDSDGMLELLLTCGESSGQKLRLFKCPPNNNSWLRVRPRTRFGAPARGAVVKVRCAGRQQLRVIDGGGVGGCQMEPVAHFGLGSETGIESLSVRWPDGVSLTMKEVPLRVLLDLPYPG